MAFAIRQTLLPTHQRRTLDELTEELDPGVGDLAAKRSAFWTMLTLSAVIASAGVLGDSTATVIGAMIIAPLSTPIMAIALAIAKREQNQAVLVVVGGVLLVIAIGMVFSLVLPEGYVLLDNGQIAGRVSPKLIDMAAALATGLAGAVALARRDVAAILPGVAIAISLVPPLAVVGVCLGAGDPQLALGALLLFISNLLALILAGAFVFAVLGYADEAMQRGQRSQRRAYTVLTLMMIGVLLPLVGNTAANYLLSSYTRTVDEAARAWLTDTPGATVTGVHHQGSEIVVAVRTPAGTPPTASLRDRLDGRIPGVLGIRVDTTSGEEAVVRRPAW